MPGRLVPLTLAALVVLAACHAVSPPVVQTSPTAPVQAVVHRLVPRDTVTAIAFANGDHGWRAAGQTVYVTTDGGQRWQQTAHLRAVITDMDFVSAQQGWAATATGLQATGDGGRTWQLVTVPGDPAIERVSFADARHGWVGEVHAGTGAGQAATGPVLWSTADGGASWEQLAPPCRGEPGLFSLATPSAGYYLCGLDVAMGSMPKELYRTDDGGRTWHLAGAVDREGKPDGSLPLWGVPTDLRFLDSGHGWLATDRNGSWATADGGRTWEPVGPPEEHMAAVRFPSRQHGFLLVASGSGTLIGTADGGQSWKQVYPDLSPFAGAPLVSLGAEAAVAAGTASDPAGILVTADGGHTWKQVGRVPDGLVLALSFADAQHGWALARRPRAPGGTLRLWATGDGGATWTAPSPGLGQRRWSLGALSFVDDRTGFASGDDGKLLLTRDGGATFTAVARLRPMVAALAFADSENGWALPMGAPVRTTADGARTWEDLKLPAAPRAIALRSGGYGWVLGDDCSHRPCTPLLFMFTSTDGGRTWVRYELGDLLPQSISLAPDGLHAWLTAIQGRFVTADGGRTWREVQ